jgi:glucose-1-phosphate thymidylyltransferase
MDKAVILARGLGTRMKRAEQESALSDAERAAAETGVKAMIPIDRPFLDYVLSALADAGYRHVCLVVAPDHEAIRSYYHGTNLTRVKLDFAVQVEPKGTADAVAAAERFADSDPFTVINSDNYYPVEALRELRNQEGFAAALFERESMLSGSNIAPDRVRSFAVAQVSPDRRLERILEKPDAATLATLPKPHWLSMNCWRFTPAIFEACRKIAPSPRNEFEVTDAVQYVIDVLRLAFHAVTVRAPVLDLTSRQDIATIKPILSRIEVRL